LSKSAAVVFAEHPAESRSPSIPDYEVISHIGSGSYGDVWLVRSREGVLWAAKVVHRNRFQDERPYEREFAGLRNFRPISSQSPAFVQILNTGRDDAAGYFFYVMELADNDGPSATVSEARTTTTNVFPAYVPLTLARLLKKERRLPVAECLRLGLELSKGVYRLHLAGLIHRDIKPSNIIFVGGMPKLADIGLVVEQVEAEAVVGTEGYIPPEGPNTVQSDIYALGKVLYEAGMGMNPSEFPRPCGEMADGPDAETLRELNGVILRACAPRATDRYPSVLHLAGDLAWLLEGKSILKRRRHLQLRKRAVSAGVLVLALASAGIALLIA